MFDARSDVEHKEVDGVTRGRFQGIHVTLCSGVRNDLGRLWMPNHQDSKEGTSQCPAYPPSRPDEHNPVKIALTIILPRRLKPLIIHHTPLPPPLGRSNKDRLPHGRIHFRILHPDEPARSQTSRIDNEGNGTDIRQVVRFIEG